MDSSACSALVLVGGALVDVQAQPGRTHDLRTGGSVPGQVLQVAGGVARNIAEGAARLLSGIGAAAHVLLVSVVGDDAAGDAVVASCSKQGLPIHGIERCPGASTPCVCTVLDGQGEVAASVADVDTVERLLTPALVRRFGPQISGAKLVVLDGNLSAAAIQEAAGLASRAGVAVLYEPVSVAKAVRCVHVLHQLRHISPNVAELLAIARVVQQSQTDQPTTLPALPDDLADQPPVQQVQHLLPHVKLLLCTGLHTIILTLGASGAALLARQGRSLHVCHIPALPATIMTLTGAGDALVAGFAAAIVSGAEEKHALALGVACARAAVESRHNVAEALQWDAMQLAAQQVLAQATHWEMPLASCL